MKKLLSGMLTAMVLSLLLAALCLPANRPIDDTGALASAETSITPVPTPEPVYDGFLYLTVSRITFSHVGEQEQIYTGTIPAHAVTFGSMDESVAVFEDGVLRAKGVGETTVYAEYKGQRLEAIAGCLAKDEVSLKQVPMETLRQPKRYPPAAEQQTDYFKKTAIIGDSISYIMWQNHTRTGGLGKPVFMVRGGISVNSLANSFGCILYKGKETPIQNALKKSKVERCYILLGTNDLYRLSVKNTMKKWEQLIGNIQKKNPKLEIYIQSTIPVWRADDDRENAKNVKIKEHNVALKKFAEEKGLHWMDLDIYVEDHTGKMATEYSLDKKIHMNTAGCKMWIQALNAYADYEQRIWAETAPAPTPTPSAEPTETGA